MGTKIDFLYLSEQDMIKAGVKNMKQCVETMEDMIKSADKNMYGVKRERKTVRR